LKQKIKNMNKFLKSILIFTVLFSSPSFAGNSKLFSAGIPSLAPMLEDVTPAVVNIYTISETPQRNQLIDDPFLRKFFNIPGQQKSKKRNRSGLGSGVINPALPTIGSSITPEMASGFSENNFFTASRSL